MRAFFVILLLFFIGLPQPVRAYSLGDLVSEAGSYLSDRVPKTCDENFWNVLTDRAWMQAQREITQNGNLLAKPDSTLIYSCFENYMNKLATESEDNYPTDPNESFDDSFLDLGRRINELAMSLYNAPLAADPFLKNRVVVIGPSVHMESVLEILILDTLMSDVSAAQLVSSAENAGAAVCGRNFYIEDGNFHHRVLGNRAGFGILMNNELDNNVGWSRCDAMARAWDAARCYNFNAEPTHDGFYDLQKYVTDNGNYRTHLLQCTDTDNLFNISTAAELGGLICDVYFHGLPAIPFNLYWPWSGVPPKTWASANTGANRVPGTPGAVEPYNTFAPLYEPAMCTSQAPVKTGLVVKLLNGTTYDDAYCLAPGCWYNPAVSVTQCQPL